MGSGPDTDRGRTVLVVDDEERIRALVGEMLRMAGYDTVLAAGPEEAMAAIDRETPVDLLLTDLKMPRIDGQELAARLQARKPDLKVIYMTGYAGNETSPPNVLPKPFRIGDLLQKVAEALSTLQPSAST